MATNQANEVFQHLRRTALLPDGAGLTDGQLLESFLSRRDAAAMEVLVRRHGPMVWGLCRRILQNHHDAEDAFQATFLVLVRRAASIASRELLGNWLYGVAHRTALKARAMVAKRKGRERQVTDMPEPAKTELLWDDLEPLLDQELTRLPETYRVVIVLCDLQGKTRHEVDGQLGLPEGTVASRLARARAMLAKRLTQRGVTLSSGALAAVLSQKAASACVPPSVVSATIQAVIAVVSGQAVASSGVISAKVAMLTEGAIKAMWAARLKGAVAVMLALVFTTTGEMVVTGVTTGPDAVSPSVADRVIAARKQDREEDLTAWGNEQGGLQAGLGYRPGQRRAYRLGETVMLVVRVRNVGKEGVTLQYSPHCVIDNPPAITDAGGQSATFTPFSKVHVKKEVKERRVDPGEALDLDSLKIALKPAGANNVSDVPTLFARPGKYRIRMNRLAPTASNNILGKLATGQLELKILDAGKNAEQKAPPAKTRGDRELIQGKWEVVRVEISGTSAVDGDKEEREVIVVGDTLTVVYKTRTCSMRYTLDPSEQPRTIDLVPTAEEKDITLKGIYKLEKVLGLGDQLTLCFCKNGASGAARPITFERGKENSEDGGRTLYVLRRPAITKANLQGQWESPVDGVGESGLLTFRPDGTFRYEMCDVALGWTTTVSGTWKFDGDRSLVLQEQDRLQDGRPVRGKGNQTERLCPVCKDGEWTLVSTQGGREFRKARKATTRIGSPGRGAGLIGMKSVLGNIYLLRHRNTLVPITRPGLTRQRIDITHTEFWEDLNALVQEHPIVTRWDPSARDGRIGNDASDVVGATLQPILRACRARTRTYLDD
jgi:RNA polymerase sigma factor (sigma-70 family)